MRVSEKQHMRRTWGGTMPAVLEAPVAGAE